VYHCSGSGSGSQTICGAVITTWILGLTIWRVVNWDAVSVAYNFIGISLNLNKYCDNTIEINSYLEIRALIFSSEKAGHSVITIVSIFGQFIFSILEILLHCTRQRSFNFGFSKDGVFNPMDSDKLSFWRLGQLLQIFETVSSSNNGLLCMLITCKEELAPEIVFKISCIGTVASTKILDQKNLNKLLTW
jgi:hypothetical protein